MVASRLGRGQLDDSALGGGLEKRSNNNLYIDPVCETAMLAKLSKLAKPGASTMCQSTMCQSTMSQSTMSQSTVVVDSRSGQAR